MLAECTSEYCLSNKDYTNAHHTHKVRHCRQQTAAASHHVPTEPSFAQVQTAAVFECAILLAFSLDLIGCDVHRHAAFKLVQQAELEAQATSAMAARVQVCFLS